MHISKKCLSLKQINDKFQYFLEDVESIDDFLLANVTESMVNVEKSIEHEIDNRVDIIKETSLKDLFSLNWVPIETSRLTETAMQMFDRLDLLIKEIDESWKIEDKEMRDEINKLQLKIYFKALKWKNFGK